MVRIRRNDAAPRPKINLVSDDEEAPSESSSSESSSSSDVEAEATPSPLSDFIEEDDGPQPLPKSFSSSWEPVKRRRRPIRTLRKKPRLDKLDVDEEESTSTTSTSSEGIPTPDVAADADEDEGEGEHVQPPSPRTPSKRRRPPRRLAAPVCFLDALNKFVEPMSKEAVEYSKRSIHEIWHRRSDDKGSDDASDDSSLEYIPNHQENEAEDTEDDATEEAEAEVEVEIAEEVVADEKDRRGGSSRARFPLGRQRLKRSTNSYRSGSSHVVGSDEDSPTEEEAVVRLRNTEDVPIRRSPFRRKTARRAQLDLSETDEDVPLTDVLEKKTEALKDQEPATGFKYIDRENVGAVPTLDKGESEIIDLCSDDEGAVSSVDDEPGKSNIVNVKNSSNCKKEEVLRNNGNCEEEDYDEDQRIRRHKSTSVITSEDCSPSGKRNTSFALAWDDDTDVSPAADRDVIHERNARIAAGLSQNQTVAHKTEYMR